MKSFRNISYDALSYCLLAEEKIDAVIESNLKPYDIIPLIPIIKNQADVSQIGTMNLLKKQVIYLQLLIKNYNKLLKELKNI